MFPHERCLGKRRTEIRSEAVLVIKQVSQFSLVIWLSVLLISLANNFSFQHFFVNETKFDLQPFTLQSNYGPDHSKSNSPSIRIQIDTEA